MFPAMVAMVRDSFCMRKAEGIVKWTLFCTSLATVEYNIKQARGVPSFRPQHLNSISGLVLGQTGAHCPEWLPQPDIRGLEPSMNISGRLALVPVGLW